MIISHHEKEYEEARLFKEGRRKLVGPFAQMADWVANEFGVPRPLLVRFEYPDGSLLLIPRLDIIFDLEETACGFDEHVSAEIYAGPDEEKQKVAVAEFVNILANYPPPREPSIIARFLGSRPAWPTIDDCHRLFALFSSFERPAREEANASISKQELEDLKQELRPLGVWTIYPIFDAVAFLFHTDAQAELAISNGGSQRCIDRYNEILFSKDRYGYFARRPVHVRIDSRETFERDYGGHWRNFWG
ncbi:hypothetical protein [Parerythrobacter aestuarii]|uniref:hypothetical protein n=1 Tax=Parerythrobacter aestuarii TaxID=3020909 RepID=UPI0024DEEE43|nr:hypothetical protein [Parerythrobacter aestuarii]